MNLHPVLATSVVSLAAAVDEIACCVALAAPPATQFAYGGLSMHVGGRMAEVASGQLWDTLFAQRSAVPLGMTHADYEGLGPTNNPRMDGGARSSPAAGGTRYGLGTWRDVVDGEGEPVRVSSPGAFGFTPWLELDLGYYGVFLVASNNQQLRDEIQQIQGLARAEIAACTATAPPAVAATSAAGRAALIVALAAVSFAATRAGRPSRVSRR